MPGTPFSVLCRLNRTLKKKKKQNKTGGIPCLFHCWIQSFKIKA